MRVKTRGLPQQPRKSPTLKGQREQRTRTKEPSPESCLQTKWPLMYGMGDIYKEEALLTFGDGQVPPAKS